MKPRRVGPLAPSNSGSKNGCQGSLAPLSSPLPSIAHHLGPRQIHGPGQTPRHGDVVGPIEFGGPAVSGEATDGDGDENGSRDTATTSCSVSKLTNRTSAGDDTCLTYSPTDSGIEPA